MSCALDGLATAPQRPRNYWTWNGAWILLRLREEEKREMQIVALQFDIAWEDRSANLDTVRTLLGRTDVEPGALVVLPEMFAAAFSMNVERIAEEPGGETETFLAETARTHRAHVLAGVVTRGPDGRGRNEAVLFDPDGAPAGRYQKIHPFSFAGETDHYAPGDDVLLAPVGKFTLSPFICYDLRFPEVFRRAVRRGANLFTVIANWPAARAEHWTALLRARAIENQAYVVGVNRCGRDPKNAYPGQSAIFDPRGEAIETAGEGETVLTATLDIDRLEAYRRDFPALQDMREG